MSEFVNRILKEVGDLNNIAPFEFKRTAGNQFKVEDEGNKIYFEFVCMVDPDEELDGGVVRNGVYSFAFTFDGASNFKASAGYLMRIYKTAEILMRQFVSEVRPDMIVFNSGDGRKNNIYRRLVKSNSLNGYKFGFAVFIGTKVMALYNVGMDEEVKRYFKLIN